MTYYAWVISVFGRQDIRHFTTLSEMQDHLRVLNLPGVAPPQFITIDAEMPGNGTFTYDKGGKDEWSLTWTKVDSETDVLD